MSLFSSKYQKKGGPSLLNRAAPVPAAPAVAPYASGQGASAPSASGQGASAPSGESNADKKITAAFALYKTTKEELTELGKEKAKEKIRMVFVPIARKNHPDKWSRRPNSNTKQAATKRFKEYSEARDIISKVMDWSNEFVAEKAGGTRKRNRKTHKTRKNRKTRKN